jgi:hypothetical protein
VFNYANLESFLNTMSSLIDFQSQINRNGKSHSSFRKDGRDVSNFLKEIPAN